MTHPLETYQARGASASDRLDRDVRFYTVADLARRWSVGETTVRAIPTSQLPWKNMGRGLKNVLRRYRPVDVARFEDTHPEFGGEGLR